MMFKTILKVMVIGGLLVFIAWGGLCVYVNFIEPRIQQQETELAEAPDARYEVLIRVTGQVIYTDDYTQQGDIYTLHGYWELERDEYVYRDRNLTLDEATFSDIIITRRE